MTNTILQAKEVGDELNKKKVGYKLYIFLVFNLFKCFQYEILIAFFFFLMQPTLMVVLNPRPDEQTFYNAILSNPHDILARGVEDYTIAKMQVDKEDLEEAEAAATFV